MKKVKKENTEGWEQELQDKLGSHVSEPPTALWESIIHDVHMQERPRPVYHMRRWVTVAAMVALVSLIGELVWQRYMGANGVIDEKVGSVQIDRKGFAVSEQKSTTNSSNSLPILSGVVHNIVTFNMCSKMGDKDENSEHNDVDDNSEIIIAEIEEDPKSDNSVKEVLEIGQSQKSSQNLLADNSYPINSDKSKYRSKNRSLNVSLSASGLPVEGSSDPFVSVISSDPGTGLFVGSDVLQREGVLQQDAYEHHYPLKIGLSLAWQLTEHVEVETGVNYTYLHSTVTKLGSGQNTSITSSVNYLGIPATLSYRIWQNDCFSVYSGIGGEVAKSLQGDQWQLSTMMSVGIQYNFNKTCGLYLQPSIDYYFDNHSDIKTYYSEHPLMPSLQLGLRFNIK